MKSKVVLGHSFKFELGLNTNSSNQEARRVTVNLPVTNSTRKLNSKFLDPINLGKLNKLNYWLKVESNHIAN